MSAYFKSRPLIIRYIQECCQKWHYSTVTFGNQHLTILKQLLLKQELQLPCVIIQYSILNWAWYPYRFLNWTGSNIDTRDDAVAKFCFLTKEFRKTNVVTGQNLSLRGTSSAIHF